MLVHFNASLERINYKLGEVFNASTFRDKVDQVALLVAQGADNVFNRPRFEAAKGLLGEVYLTPLAEPIPYHLGFWYDEGWLVSTLVHM